MTREEAKSCIGTIELLQRLAYNIHGVMDVIDAGNCKKIIEALKKEPIKGHWIKHPHECGINWEYSMYECSECHEWTEDNSDFCPNCGTDMREGEE